jgi:hypothetical protein
MRFSENWPQTAASNINSLGRISEKRPCQRQHSILRTTKRIMELLETVNPTAVNNDDGKPGEFLAELCKEDADRSAS